LSDSRAGGENAPVPPGPSRWLLEQGRLPFGLLLVAHLALLWWFPWVPTTDGSMHVETAHLLLRYHADAPDGALYREWFNWTAPAAPNWLGHAALSALLLLAPPLVAEKLLLTVYVVAFPLSVRRALRAIAPDSAGLALLAFPFTFSWLFHMGFYNFCLALPVFFATLAHWLENRSRLAARSLLALTGWLALLYAAHPVPLVLLGLVVACVLGADLFWALRSARSEGSSVRERAAPILRSAGRTALPFLPTAILLIVYAQGQPSWGWTVPFPLRLRALATLDVVATFHPSELTLGRVLAIGIGGLCVVALRARLRPPRPREGDGLLLATLALTALVFVAPQGMAGGTFLLPRLALFPAFGALLWVACLRLPALIVGIAGSVGAATSVLLLVSLGFSYRDANARREEYVSAAPLIERGSVLLPLNYGWATGSFPRVDVFAHVASQVAVARDSIELTYFQGSAPGIFPLDFETRRNPYRILGRTHENVPPCADLFLYEAESGQRIDYVLTWREPPGETGVSCVDQALRQLRTGFTLAHASPRGLARLWRRRDPVPLAATPPPR
jgi:hypothetical protein